MTQDRIDFENTPLTRTKAARIVDSMHFNGDSVDDVTYCAAMAAIDLRQPIRPAEMRAEFIAQGTMVDDYGWVTVG